ncbi:hypothetical protein D3C72_1815890 [compost metagenome]
MQALALTDHGQVIGLQAHGQIAETEQTEDQHGGSGQGFPVRTQARQHADFCGLRCQGLRALGDWRTVPDRLGPGKRFGVRRVGREPLVELAGLFFARAVQHDQPVQGLVHRLGCSLRRGRRRGAVGVRHGVYSEG